MPFDLFLAHLSHLRGLRLCGAKVSGDVRKLNPLECLELLDLNQCLKVKGSVRRLGVLNELAVQTETEVGFFE